MTRNTGLVKHLSNEQHLILPLPPVCVSIFQAVYSSMNSPDRRWREGTGMNRRSVLKSLTLGSAAAYPVMVIAARTRSRLPAFVSTIIRPRRSHCSTVSFEPPSPIPVMPWSVSTAAAGRIEVRAKHDLPEAVDVNANVLPILQAPMTAIDRGDLALELYFP